MLLKSDLDVWQTGPQQKWVCWTSKSDLSSTKCDPNHILAIMNLLTPKAAPKHEVLFKKPASAFIDYVWFWGRFIEQWVMLSCNVRCDQIQIVTDMILVTLCCAT